MAICQGPSINVGIEKHIPITEYPLKNNPEWKQSLPLNTRKLIKKKHRLWTRYQVHNNKDVEDR